MLDLLEGRTEGIFRLVERELRCGCWTWNLHTNEMRWSRGYYDLLGIEPGQVTPCFAAILEVTHPEDRRPQAEVERVIRGASTVRRKFRVIRPGGVIAWLFCQIIVLVDSEGISQKALGICADITGRKEQLDSLRSADERYQALIKATNAVVWIAKSDGSIHELMNWETSRSEPQEVVLDSGWIELVHPEDKEQTLRTWEDAIRQKRSYGVVHRMRQSDGNYRWKRSSGQPVLDHHGKVKEWIGINIDLEYAPRRSYQRGPITGAQIRAGRGLLRWSVLDLADAAGVSRATIRRLEEVDGSSSQSDPALPPIEMALSNAGVEFFFPDIGKPGVRPR